jgi:hypothetical protein
MAALIIAVVALVVAVISAIISARELREARKANAFPAAIDLFREFRDPDFVADRRLLLRELENCDPETGMSGLPDGINQAAFRVSHYLDNVGVLVAHKLIDPEIAVSFLGASALSLWQALSDFIRRERELRSYADYQMHFEHLAATVDALQLDSGRLGWRKMP